MLRPLAPDLWTVDFPRGMLGIQFGGRMTVIRLPDGGLLLHSPGGLEPGVVAELAALGPVRLLVAPNTYHHLFVPAALAAFPGARALAAPGLPEKRADIPFAAVLSDEPPPEAREVLFQHVVAGMPKINEVALLHRPSRTLLLTDLAFNLVHSDSFLTRTAMKLYGAYGKLVQTGITRGAVKDRAATRASFDRILAWDFDRLIVSHGQVLETGAKEALRGAMAWCQP